MLKQQIQKQESDHYNSDNFKLFNNVVFCTLSNNNVSIFECLFCVSYIGGISDELPQLSTVHNHKWKLNGTQLLVCTETKSLDEYKFLSLVHILIQYITPYSTTLQTSPTPLKGDTQQNAENKITSTLKEE